MKNWNEYYSKLICLNCGNSLIYSEKIDKFKQYNNLTGELNCISCSESYPIYDGIPIMFNDVERTKVLIDKDDYEAQYKKTLKKMAKIKEYSGDQLKNFINKNERNTDSISWEILFWERWKAIDKDKGFLNFDNNKINEFLNNDKEGGGRLKFFNKVVSFCNNSIKDKYLLNIGAGRDFLLEKFLNEDCNVIEQDVILEALIYLKKRGASFCICSDARKIPFKDNTFDIATSFGTLHHIWPIKEPIEELLRVTKGNIHFNEPNYFSLTRVALLFPNFIKRKLKRFYSGELAHSPYEEVINPYKFKQIIKNRKINLIDFSYPKSSWISSNFNLIKKILRNINILLAYIFPFVSSHFDVTISKSFSGIKSN